MLRAVNMRMALIRENQPIRTLSMPAPESPQQARLTDPAAPAPEKTKAGAARKTETPRNAENSTEPGKPLPQSRQGQRFMFPIEVERRPERQILVQVEPPEMKAKIRVALPQVILWQQPLPPKPKPQVVAAHAEEQPVREPETPPVQPRLNARNQEQTLAELRHANSPAVTIPEAPLPVANTTPIQIFDGIPGIKLPNSSGFTVPSPEEAHLISIPDSAVPSARVIVLPSGSHAPSPGSAGNGTNDNGTESGDRHSAKPGGSTNHETGQGVAIAMGGSGGLESRAGNGASAGTSLNGGNDAPPPNTTRIVRPKDGKYSVVITGISNLDAYPEAAGILTGKLVYSVYIRAGARKEWILQFCLPKTAEQRTTVRGSAIPLEAPYPFLIYHPNLTLLNDPDYLIVHGFITAAGRFDHLSAFGDIDSASKQLLLGALEHWEFRPASKDGEPSIVEIALIIPREP
jgi:hypothetical protein